jgi:hypothetical protein
MAGVVFFGLLMGARRTPRFGPHPRLASLPRCSRVHCILFSVRHVVYNSFARKGHTLNPSCALPVVWLVPRPAPHHVASL